MIKVTLRPNMTFTDAVKEIESLWRLTKQNIPIAQTLEGLDRLLELRQTTPEAAAEWEQCADHARRVMLGEMPLAHYIGFTWVIEGHNRAFLDQFVRELVTGIDVWTGSNRILDMSNFVDNGFFQNCSTVAEDPVRNRRRIERLRTIERLFREEMQDGATIEEARELLPMVVSLPVTCTASIRRLRWVISKRTSFVLQKSLWGEVIRQTLDQLAEWDLEIATHIRTPPCILRGRCPSEIDIEERGTPKYLNPGESVEEWIETVEADPQADIQPRDFRDPNPLCPVYVDRFAPAAQREALLRVARAKHPDWDKIAGDYFRYAGITPENIPTEDLE